MDQMQKIGESNTNTLAIQHGIDGVPTTASIPTPSIPPTSTAQDLITIETMAVDAGEHKKGDVVFHIPKDSRARIQDFLHMIGIDSVSKSCEGQDLLSSSNSRVRVRDSGAWETCLRELEHFVPAFAKGPPQAILQLAPESFPVPPTPGQAIGFPIPKLQLDGTSIVIPAYRLMRANTPKPAPAPPEIANAFNIPTLVLSAFAVTVVAHAIMYGGEVALDLWVSASDLAEVKQEDFQCPHDILCIQDECKAQKEDTVIKLRDAVCKEKKYANCPCQPVFFPEHTQVRPGYMDMQYHLLEELLEVANAPPEPEFEVRCEGHLQKADDLVPNFKNKMGEFCTNHKKLQDGLSVDGPNGDKYWIEGAIGLGYSWSVHWKSQVNKKDTCNFDCETVFNAFAESSDYVKDDGVLKFGKIDTDCGTAGYLVSIHNPELRKGHMM